MNGLAKRRSHSWVERHFAGPRTFEPQSMMPPYKLSTSDLRNLTAYLFGLLESFIGCVHWAELCPGQDYILASCV
jgi:hypothetical protein